MIERFDFYDIYGYLLPGAALLIELWFPFGLVTHQWPAAEWSSALVLVAIAYVAGILLHGLAANAFPEARLHPGGRYPSGFLLDADDPFFADQKQALLKELSEFYGADVSADGRDGRRRDAFLMCRALLRAKDLAGYAEHMQGLYVLLRGLTAASLGGASFLLGWWIGTLAAAPVATFAALAVIIVLGLIYVAGESAALSYWLGIGGAFCAGAFFAIRLHASSEQGFALLAVAFLLLAIVTRSYAAYRYFTEKFAEMTYRDFFALRRASL